MNDDPSTTNNASCSAGAEEEEEEEILRIQAPTTPATREEEMNSHEATTTSNNDNDSLLKKKRSHPSTTSLIVFERGLEDEIRRKQQKEEISRREKNQQNPTYIAYFDDPSSGSIHYTTTSNNPLPALPAADIHDDLAAEEEGPMPIPTDRDNNIVPQQQGPGAYDAGGGRGTNTPPRRLNQLRFSVVGGGDGRRLSTNDTIYEEQADLERSNSAYDDEGFDNYNIADDEEAYIDSYQGEYDNNNDGPDPSRNSGDPTNTDDDHDLAVARAIQDDDFSSALIITQNAEEMDPEVLERQETQSRKRRECRRVGYAIIAVCSIVLGVALGLSNLGGPNKKEAAEPLLPTTTSFNVAAPTLSPTPRPLPPMVNLELLYAVLPEKTRESLYNNSSHQYRAWQWLLNHPNITTYPEWRKEQIFAMATFYYSFQGPKWPIGFTPRDRWLNYVLSECEWVFTDLEVRFLYVQGVQIFGPNAYELEDFYPCNQEGRLQMLAIHQLFLPRNDDPVPDIPMIPPQIGLLTSLNSFGIAFGQMGAADIKLSDWLTVPEFLRLPNLQGLNLRGNGAHGTIPKQIGTMTGLRHLLIGANALTGSIPSEIAGMKSLEYMNIGDEAGIRGALPTEVGLMTTLTGLSIYRTAIGGTIPTQMGLLSGLKTVYLDGNTLSGTIPSQLGLWKDATLLSLGKNDSVTPGGGGGGSQSSSSSSNNFWGSLPTNLWELSRLEYLYLSNLPNLYGRVPNELIMPNLTKFSLSGSPHLSGTIPDQACLFVDELDFDCSDLLCGCDCECEVAGVVNQNRGETIMVLIDPIYDDPEWPGLFPTSLGTSNSAIITINIKTDRHPEETKYEWSTRNESGLWNILDSEQPQEQDKLHAYTKEVQSNSVYRLELFDSKGDGTCCTNGIGWFTITDSTPSPDYGEGTVIWEDDSSILVGGSSYHVYLWVDGEGRAKVLEHLTGPRH